MLPAMQGSEVAAFVSHFVQGMQLVVPSPQKPSSHLVQVNPSPEKPDNRTIM